jgi:xanthine/uracil permease
MKTSEIVELIASSLMVVGVLCIMVHRIVIGAGIGARVIQYVAVVLVIPAILILALEKILTPETTATLFGTITGYLLSGIGEFKPEAKKNQDKDKEKDSDNIP